MLSAQMIRARQPNLPRMAELALERLGRPTELVEIYDHVRALGFQPSSDLVGIAELGTALYRNRDRFAPLSEDTWILAAWDAREPNQPTEPPDLTASIKALLAKEQGALTLRTLVNRLNDTTHPDVGTSEVLEALKAGEEFELVSPGRYALRGTVPSDPLLELWLPEKPTPASAPIAVSDEDVAHLVILLSHYDRLMSAEEIVQEAVSLRGWKEASVERAHAILDSRPERFIRIKDRYYGLPEWEGSAKALLFGSGWPRVLASLIHEHLRNKRRGEDVEGLIMTLGNDPRWPVDAPKSVKAVQALLDRYDHVFMRITRRRADRAEEREVWTLQPYARDAAPVAPRPLSLEPVHPLGPGVPLEMPHPNPLIRDELARLAHVALRHLARSATAEEILEVMTTKLKWSGGDDANEALARALAHHGDFFRKVRADRYSVKR